MRMRSATGSALRASEVTEVREPAQGLRVFDARDPDGNRFSVESRRST
jgi:hypothetical protein